MTEGDSIPEAVRRARPLTGVYRSTKPRTLRLSGGLRALAGLFACVCFGVLLTAFVLHPDPAGHGTHRQLGLPPCLWLSSFGKPCMTCGMTTAFSYAVHGDARASIHAQPLGFVLSMATAAAFWLALHAAMTGSRMDALLGAVMKPRTLWVLLAAALGAWAYKVATYAA